MPCDLPNRSFPIATATQKIKPTEPEKLAAAKNFAIEAARMAQMTHCSQIAVLDVSGISPITDFLVLATGTSGRQMRSVCNDIDEVGRPLGFKPHTESGADGEMWIVQDFIDVIVHVFSAEARLFYDLDNLWGDAKKVEWQVQEK